MKLTDDVTRFPVTVEPGSYYLGTWAYDDDDRPDEKEMERVRRKLPSRQYILTTIPERHPSKLRHYFYTPCPMTCQRGPVRVRIGGGTWSWAETGESWDKSPWLRDVLTERQKRHERAIAEADERAQELMQRLRRGAA